MLKNIFFNKQGLKAIHSPLTGIVDYAVVARNYGKEFENMGGKVFTDFKVEDFIDNAGKYDCINYFFYS